ncbi:HAD family hydrolase [Chitinispirillales bacterium ANBcel5]|uniref:HAD family hydrolase n=1 Tax=Cellulosispirillum alkaliphilum TaxID=3039283 RepID=UPI002A539D4C|nr:HAD family hydrolase [Chitinispirillales bacterium ANBcel5]
MKYRAVVFDLDGTLLDTLTDLGESMNSVLKRMGYRSHELDKYRYFVGDGMVMLARRSLPEGVSERVVQQCVEEMKKEYGSRWNLKSKPYNKIDEVLNSLKKRNVKLGVLSNKPEEFTQKVVEYYFDGYFDIALGAGRFAVKPDTEALVHILNMLGLRAQEVLYVGDTATDMKTAKGAGLVAVGVSWGFRDEDELYQNGADVVIKDPIELLKVLSR